MDNKSLAAAYSAKRMAKKKMAKGGMVENEMLHPEHEPMGPAESVLETQRLGYKAQNHEEIDEPIEPDSGKHYVASKENLPAQMLAKGGMVNKIMMKRKNMAQGGQVPSKLDYLDEDQSYPDPDLYEFDSLDPHQPDYMAEGGMVEEDPKMKRKKMMHNIFSSMNDDEYWLNFKDFQRFVKFAKKQGVLRLKLGTTEIEFTHDAVTPITKKSRHLKADDDVLPQLSQEDILFYSTRDPLMEETHDA